MKQGVFPPGHTLRQGQFGVKQMHSHVNPPRPLLTEPPLLAPLRYFTPALEFTCLSSARRASCPPHLLIHPLCLSLSFLPEVCPCLYPTLAWTGALASQRCPRLLMQLYSPCSTSPLLSETIPLSHSLFDGLAADCLINTN